MFGNDRDYGFLSSWVDRFIPEIFAWFFYCLNNYFLFDFDFDDFFHLNNLPIFIGLWTPKGKFFLLEIHQFFTDVLVYLELHIDIHRIYLRQFMYFRSEISVNYNALFIKWVVFEDAAKALYISRSAIISGFDLFYATQTSEQLQSQAGFYSLFEGLSICEALLDQLAVHADTVVFQHG